MYLAEPPPLVVLRILRELLKDYQIMVKQPDQAIYCPVDAVTFLLAIIMARLQDAPIEPFDLIMSNIRSMKLVQLEVKLVVHEFVIRERPDAPPAPG